MVKHILFKRGIFNQRCSKNKMDICVYDDEASILPNYLFRKPWLAKEEDTLNDQLNDKKENYMKKPMKATRKLDTFRGVFVPCFQSMFSVIFFIRLIWIISRVGIGMSLLIVLVAGISVL